MSVVSGLVGYGGRRSAGYRKHITKVSPYVNDQGPHKLSGSGYAKRTIVSRDAPQQYSYRRPGSNIAKEMKKFLETQALYGSTINVVPGTGGPAMSSQTLIRQEDEAPRGQAAEVAPQPTAVMPDLLQPSPTGTDMSIDAPQVMVSEGGTQTQTPVLMDGGTQYTPQNMLDGGTQTYIGQGVGSTQTQAPVLMDGGTQYTPQNMYERGTQYLPPHVTPTSPKPTAPPWVGGIKNPRFTDNENLDAPPRKMQTLLPEPEPEPLPGRGDDRTRVVRTPYTSTAVQAPVNPWVIPRPAPSPLSVVTNPQRQLPYGAVGGVYNPMNISPDEPTLEQVLYGGSPNSSSGSPLTDMGELSRHLIGGEANPVVISSPSSRGSISNRSPSQGSNSSRSSYYGRPSPYHTYTPNGSPLVDSRPPPLVAPRPPPIITTRPTRSTRNNAPVHDSPSSGSNSGGSTYLPSN